MRSLHGYQVKLRHMAPPPIVKRPFNNLVLNLVIPTAGTETFYTPAAIGAGIIGQLGLAAADIGNINFKISEVHVYTMATASDSDRPAVSLNASSTIPSISDSSSGGTDVFYSIIKRLQDVGNLSEAARVGFHWPSHMADMPLSASQSFCVFAAAGNCANTTVRIHLRYSHNSDSAPVA